MVRAQEARQRVGAGHSAVAVSEAAAALPASTRQTAGWKGRKGFSWLEAETLLGAPSRLDLMDRACKPAHSCRASP
eukprot:1159670-Pelagomonas_calceolata.AAC.7